MLCLLGAAVVVERNRMEDAPATILGAWERPEDLRFLDPRRAGVAFLATTLDLRDGRVVVRPRMQPLRAPKGTYLIAVVRIGSHGTPAEHEPVVAAILEQARLPGIAAVQIDFDARSSERPFYRQLLRDLRLRLPPSMPLSMTALASWCLGDRWLGDLPIDEAIPMLFRLGADRQAVLSHLETGGDFRASECRDSIGIATDETLARIPAGRRRYFFHPRPWTPEAVAKVLAER